MHKVLALQSDSKPKNRNHSLQEWLRSRYGLEASIGVGEESMPRSVTVVRGHVGYRRDFCRITSCRVSSHRMLSWLHCTQRKPHLCAASCSSCQNFCKGVLSWILDLVERDLSEENFQLCPARQQEEEQMKTDEFCRLQSKDGQTTCFYNRALNRPDHSKAI
jgi:hypothetical protein